LSGDVPSYIREAARITDKQNLSAEEASMLSKELLARYDREAAEAYRIEEAEEKAMARGRAEGEARGIARGREEGKENAQLELAQNLLASNLDMDIDTVAQLTGLDAKTVERLRS
jgi:predicted transposase/invertase (TIGR01784 family)